MTLLGASTAAIDDAGNAYVLIARPAPRTFAIRRTVEPAAAAVKYERLHVRESSWRSAAYVAARPAVDAAVRYDPPVSRAMRRSAYGVKSGPPMPIAYTEARA